MENLCPICQNSAVKYEINDGKYIIKCTNCNLFEKELTSTTILYTDNNEEYKKRKFPELVKLNPTFPRIKHKCEKCGKNIMVAILDTTSLKRSYICENCGAEYSNIE